MSNNPSNPIRYSHGFTLVELMVTVLIIAILASIAYPNYLHIITRTRRHDGQAGLIDLANRMEQYYALNHTYQTATLATGKKTDILDVNQSPQGWYKFAIESVSPQHYSLHAIPLKAQAIHDNHCQTLTFNDLGIRGITHGPQGQPKGQRDECWI
ncbi:MAG: type IV pilin protein [Legionella sp.]